MQAVDTAIDVLAHQKMDAGEVFMSAERAGCPRSFKLLAPTWHDRRTGGQQGQSDSVPLPGDCGCPVRWPGHVGVRREAGHG
jgi:hypothetical protein